MGPRNCRGQLPPLARATAHAAARRGCARAAAVGHCKRGRVCAELPQAAAPAGARVPLQRATATRLRVRSRRGRLLGLAGPGRCASEGVAKRQRPNAGLLHRNRAE
eukprot:5156155-Alexandrium_andersonii.AAC.1